MMKIVFMGTPDFAATVLKGLSEKYEIVLAVSQPDREKKKGKILKTPVHELAQNLGIEVFQPESIKEDYDKILNVDASVLVTAAYGQYIPSFILKKFKYRLNVHGSLLPYHRGGAPIQRAIMNGDKKTGISIIKMEKKLDAGKIYAIKEIDIEEDDNSSTLFEKLAIVGRDLLLESLPGIINGTNLGVPQDEKLATFSPNISKEEEIINFNEKSKTIINKIRGLAYSPGAYFIYKDTNVKVFKASIVPSEDKEPGTVLKIKKGVVIKTLDSAIMLDEVLLPGKKIVNGVDFSNGQKLFNVGDIIK